MAGFLFSGSVGIPPGHPAVIQDRTPYERFVRG